MAASDGVKTRILILSDTHSALPYPPETDIVPFRWPLPKADILLHAGDLTSNGKDMQHENALELLNRVDAELKIVIPGNHDITLDHDYYREFSNLHCNSAPYPDQKLHEIAAMYTGEAAQRAGVVYMVEGTRAFTLQNGATFTLYASAYQPEFYHWAFGYHRTTDRFNQPAAADAAAATFQPPCPVPDSGVDVMLTHGPPLGILDQTSRLESVGCEHLRRAVGRVRPRLHAFGHIHEAWGALRKDWDVADEEKGVQKAGFPGADKAAKDMGVYYDATQLRVGKETLFVNASIMTLQYQPLQAPWVVDLMLPKAK